MRSDPMKMVGVLSGLALGANALSCLMMATSPMARKLTPARPPHRLRPRALLPLGVATGLYIWDQPIRRGIEDMCVHLCMRLL